MNKKYTPTWKNTVSVFGIVAQVDRAYDYVNEEIAQQLNLLTAPGYDLENKWAFTSSRKPALLLYK